ncbi:MAG: hypothetical protein KatS3mg053_1443 [Candidatus Roseilinea sp.]|nr:MAG: hypothetical protein KatS3mg053_1443 [Candidatus Roseilinea sp.]
MERYLIESPHELKDCARMLQQLKAMGYLYNFDWGCKAGVHIGWAIIEAESEAQARMAVPPLVRAQARIIKLNKFSPEEVDSLHGA